MTTRLPVATAAAMVIAAAAPALAQTQWDLHIGFPDGNFHTQNTVSFAEAVAEATDGAVEIVVHSGGSLGLRGPEVLGAVRDQVVTAADYHMMQQTGELPIMGLNALPFLAAGYDEAYLLQKMSEPTLQALLGERNQHLLYSVAWPGGQVYSTEPIRTPADFEGVRIRTADPIQTDFFNGLGATSVQMPWGEVVPALAAGAIDAVTTSTSSGVDGEFWQFMGYMTRLDYVNPVSIMTVNLDAWNTLEPGEQATIDALAVAMERDFWDVAAGEDERNLGILRENGIEIVEPDDALIQAMAESGQAIWGPVAEEAGPQAVAILEVFRDTVGK